MNFPSRYKGDKAVAMVANLPPDLESVFNEVAYSSGSFHAYGHYRGICLLVVSPKTYRANFLFRD